MCVRWGRAQKKADKPGSGCDVVIASQPTGRQCGVYCLHERRTCFGVCGAVKQHVPCAVYRRVPESVRSIPAMQRDAALLWALVGLRAATRACKDEECR